MLGYLLFKIYHFCINVMQETKKKAVDLSTKNLKLAKINADECFISYNQLKKIIFIFVPLFHHTVLYLCFIFDHVILVAICCFARFNITVDYCKQCNKYI